MSTNALVNLAAGAVHRCPSSCSPRRRGSSPTSTRSRGSSAGSSSLEIADHDARRGRASVGATSRCSSRRWLSCGVHSTLFGPVKYAILPQHLQADELIGGNGLVEMGTFVAILLGTIARRLARGHRARRGSLDVGVATVAIAVAGYLAEPRAFPSPPAADPELAINWNPFTRDVAQPALRAGQPRRLAVDARHLVVLVLRRDLPHPVRQLRARTSSAATSTSSRCCSRSSRSASASARCCASACRATRSRSDWFRSARSASPCSPRPVSSRAGLRATGRRARRVLRAPGALARRSPTWC